jgi:hypothetical protein
MTTATHPAALSGIPDARAAWPFMLPFGVYILHTLEELPGFAAWATRHFGPESTGTFAAYHIPLILLVLACSWQGTLIAAAAIGFLFL